MLSTYRTQSNSLKRRQKTSNTNFDDVSNREHDLKRPQMTSKESSRKFEIVKSSTSKKNKVKRGGNIGIIDEYFDEYLYNNNH